MSRFTTARSVAAIILLITMGFSGARGWPSSPKPYLKVVGPPPLRFEAAAVNNADFLALLTLPDQRESSITNMPPSKPESERAETYTSGGTLAPVISNGGYPFGMFPFGFSPYGMFPFGGMLPWGGS